MADDYAEVRKFLHLEARLLDRGDFEAWLELFTEHGTYWIPAVPGQTDPKAVPSILYEDRPLLAMRVRRLLHPRAHAMNPPPRTAHVVGNIELDERPRADGRYRVASTLLVAEYQDNRRRVFGGQVEHTLLRSGGTLRIASKRVDLIDCDGIHEYMTVPL
jgi:benzoate/toluate 1,2-dioxygenase beta subunit